MPLQCTCAHAWALYTTADQAYGVLEASRRDQSCGRSGRTRSGDPGGLSIPGRRRPAAEAAKRLRWVTKMQVRVAIAIVPVHAAAYHMHSCWPCYA